MLEERITVVFIASWVTAPFEKAFRLMALEFSSLIPLSSLDEFG